MSLKSYEQPTPDLDPANPPANLMPEEEKNEPIPLLDLKAQYRGIRDEVLPVIERICEEQAFVLGPEVEFFEKEIAAYCQSSHAVGVSSGTDALLLSLMALDVGPGDEVIVPAFSFFATAGSVHRTGARIVFVDIDPVTFNMNPQAIEEARSSRTRAVIPVHLYGQCADMARIMEIADRYDLAVVEDAAQAIGSETEGQRAGSFGDLGCFSFFPSKNLGAFGDGGVITVQDTELYEKIRVLRMHGETSRYHHDLVGGNFRLDALQAAVLRIKLRHLDGWTTGRQANAADYNRRFEDEGLAGNEIEIPTLPAANPSDSTRRYIINQYVIRAQRRDDLIDHLRKNSIGCQIYYPVPLHLQVCFRSLGHREGEFPHSEKAATETLALPVYPEMTADQRERVVTCIRDFYRA